MELREVVDFQFVQLYSCGKDKSDNFQSIYRLELKSEICYGQFLQFISRVVMLEEF